VVFVSKLPRDLRKAGLKSLCPTCLTQIGTPKSSITNNAFRSKRTPLRSKTKSGVAVIPNIFAVQLTLVGNHINNRCSRQNIYLDSKLSLPLFRETHQKQQLLDLLNGFVLPFHCHLVICI